MLCLFELILLFILKAKPSPPTYCSVLACELTEQNVQNLFSVQTKCLQSDMLCKKTPFKFLPLFDYCYVIIFFLLQAFCI